MPDPRTVSDDEWAELWKPVSEFGGWEYRLTEESLHNYGASLRASASRRAEYPDEYAVSEGSAAPSDVVVPDFPAQNKAVLGTDNRAVLDNSWRAVWPYSMHGAMSAPLPNNRRSTCTAFKVINQHTAGTAAHCLFDDGKWGPRHDITFHDGSRGTVPAGCYIRTVGDGWTTGAQLAQEDYAVLAFSTVDGRAWCAQSTYNLGWFGTQSVGYNSEITGYVSGYPGVPPQGKSWPTLVYHERGGAEIATVRPKILLFDNDGDGGQSGTPFVTRPFYKDADGRYVWPADKQVVRAIHKGDVFNSWNQGREFDGDLIDFFRAHGGYPKGSGPVIVPPEPQPPCSPGLICFPL